MMKKSKWSDEKIEHLLTQMPEIKDRRDPHEIYQNITLNMHKKKKRFWVVPSIASAAAVLLLVILAPSFLNNMNNSSNDSAEMAKENTRLAMDSNSKETVPVEEEVSILEKSQNPERNEEYNTFSFEDQSSQNYVVNTIGENEVLLTYGVYLGGAMFPAVVSIAVESDGGNLVEQWQKHLSTVNGIIRANPSWGIDEVPESYFLDFSEIETNNQSKAVKVEVNNTIQTESFATAESDQFRQTINSFRYMLQGYQHVELYQHNQKGVIIGQTGIVENHIDVEEDTKKAYLSYQNEESDRKILALSYDNYQTIEQAFDAMDAETEQGDYSLRPTIISDIKEVKTDEDRLEVHFSENAVLENTDDYILMLDAMLLTAKEFNFKTVTFYGNIDQIGHVPFGEPVSVPLAPNPL
ncbi:hypothetical protein [Bacillus nitroreducens]